MALTYFALLNPDGPLEVETLGRTDGKSVDKRSHPSFLGETISDLVAIGSRVFLIVEDGAHDKWLWTFDGSLFNGLATVPVDLTNVNGTLYFQADDGVHGSELWKSDGTAAGTVMVRDIVLAWSARTPARHFHRSDKRQRHGLF